MNFETNKKCRLCLKTLTDDDGQYLIDEDFQQDFLNVTQIELHLYAWYPNTVCEFCYRSLQYANFLKNQFIDVQSKLPRKIIESKAAQSLKIENVCELISDDDFENDNDSSEIYFEDAVEPSTSTKTGEDKESQSQLISKTQIKARVVCDLCEVSFADTYKLKRHIQRLHTSKEDEAVNFICSECGRTFSSEKNLKNHMQYHQEPNHRCEYCNKAYHEIASLRYHITSNHLKKKEYKCSECSEAYYKQHHLNRHILRAHRNQRFMCKIALCDKVFARREKVREHIRIKHRNIPLNKLNSFIKEMRDELNEDHDKLEAETHEKLKSEKISINENIEKT